MPQVSVLKVYRYFDDLIVATSKASALVAIENQYDDLPIKERIQIAKPPFLVTFDGESFEEVSEAAFCELFADGNNAVIVPDPS